MDLGPFQSIAFSAGATARRRAAQAWLRQGLASTPGPQVILSTSREAASVPAYQLLSDAPDTVLVELHRLTLDQLALLAFAGLVPPALPSVAGEFQLALLCARLVKQAPDLEHFAQAAGAPRFPRALCRTLLELEAYQLRPEELEQLDSAAGPELAAFYRSFLTGQQALGIRSLPGLLAVAAAQGFTDHWLADARVLCYDLPLDTPVERALVAALLRDCPQVSWIGPSFDRCAVAALAELSQCPGAELLCQAALAAEAATPPDLTQLQARLFSAESAAANEARGVAFFSAPSAESECAEIARRVAGLLAEGVAPERIAVLVRQAEPYAELLAEVFGAAGIETHASAGLRPRDLAARAFEALLDCLGEGLSYRAFAEYLALDQGPVFPPETEFIGTCTSTPAEAASFGGAAVSAPRKQQAEPAAVGATATDARPLESSPSIGVAAHFAHWLRRAESTAAPADLAALAEQWQLGRWDVLMACSAQLMAQLHAIAALDDAALSWRQWIAAFCELARSALHDSEAVVARLESLGVLSGAAGGDAWRLAEVLRQVAAAVAELRAPALTRPAGRVYLGLAGDAAGQCFEAVFVAGLAERSFPVKQSQDPILPDRLRARIAGGSLAQSAQGREAERRLLQRAVGAARTRLVLSYPRMDAAAGKSRVPSLYLLEAARAAYGEDCDDEALLRAAAAAGPASLEEPFPRDPAAALGCAEYDLAVLAEARRERVQAASDRVGSAAHLHQHPRLVAALRAYWSRSKQGARRLGRYDGLVLEGTEPLWSAQPRGLSERPHQVKELELFARCPFRYYLAHVLGGLSSGASAESVWRPAARELRWGPPLLRAVEAALAGAGLLPLESGQLPRAREVALAALTEGQPDMSAVLGSDSVGKGRREAILDGLERWLHTEAMREQGSPGLAALRLAHPYVAAGQRLGMGPGGYLFEGTIDRVDQQADGSWLISDYRAGQRGLRATSPWAGGRRLAGVIAALAWERRQAEASAALLTDAAEGPLAADSPLAASASAHRPSLSKNAPMVAAGSVSATIVLRQYYCAELAAAPEQRWPLDSRCAEQAWQLLAVIDGYVREGFFPLLPHEPAACAFCPYSLICADQGRAAVAAKSRDSRLEGLAWLRLL